METGIFEQFPESWGQALKRSAEVRTARAQLKQDLAAGRDPYKVIRKPPDYAEKMKVEALLMSVPGIGRVKVTRLLRLCDISPLTTLGHLTKRQRGILIKGIKEKTWTG